MLHRDDQGALAGRPIDTGGIKPKAYRTERRQFAETILGRAVLVVEGSTEASLLPVASSVLEDAREGYTHIDLAGVSIFTANGDSDVPRYGPIFKALGKKSFGFVDKQTKPWPEKAQSDLASFDEFWESSERGIEELLVGQTTTEVLRRFLAEVSQRDDFPTDQATYNADVGDDDLAQVALNVLKARKGDAYGYAAILIEQCQTEDELPEFLRDVLITIDAALAGATDEDPLATPASTGPEGSSLDESVAS
jgi:putative ATP-dependent endonuclease of OLD family